MKGFTLIELLVSLFVVGTLLASVGAGYKLVSSQSVKVQAKLAAESEAISLFRHLSKVGKGSIKCMLPPKPTPTDPMSEIWCLIDRSGLPKLQPLVQVRFVWNSTKQTVEYQEEIPGKQNEFQTQITYQGIREFSVLDDEAMASPREANELSRQHVRNRTQRQPTLRTMKGRFFRFRFRSFAPYQQAMMRDTTMQGAFYVRSPTPKSLGHGHYVWGSKTE